tara:strand:+ start:960 stop:1148 length:189 start_codon:yes stop_codon:yes gene_type:complete
MSEPEFNEDSLNEEEPKWDYTTSRDAQLTGAVVIAANFLVLILFLLYKYVPAAHQFISGKPI